MIDTAAHHKRVVQVGTQQRSGVQYRRCVELLRSGHIGDVRHVRIASHRNIMPGFTQPVGTQPFSKEAWSMWLGPAPYVPYEPGRCLYHFRWFWDYSGGQTTNLLAHSIDIVQWALDALPRSVAAMGARYSLKGIGETPDVFEAIYEYPGFVLNWSSREMSAGRAGRGSGLEFCGTRGTLVVNRQGLEVIPDATREPEDQIPRFTGPRRRPAAADAAGAGAGLAGRTEAIKEEGYEEIRDQFQPHVRNFIDCVKSRQTPASDLLGGHQTATSCHLANIAMKVGRRLRWDAEKEAIVSDAEAARLLTKEYRAPWDRELKAALPNPAAAARGS
jgi:predicted dehydrogenase